VDINVNSGTLNSVHESIIELCATIKRIANILFIYFLEQCMARGGKREGAGRKSGSGQFGETTKPIRMPNSLVALAEVFTKTKGFKMPFYNAKVPAGYPDDLDDSVAEQVSLYEKFAPNLESTFLIQAMGESMINTGIYPNDTLIVDKSLEAQHGKVVIASVNGELTVKRLHKQNNEIRLLPENPDFSPIEIDESTDLQIIGIVTQVIHGL
jgi:DNA polymerase V